MANNENSLFTAENLSILIRVAMDAARDEALCRDRYDKVLFSTMSTQVERDYARKCLALAEESARQARENTPQAIIALARAE